MFFISLPHFDSTRHGQVSVQLDVNSRRYRISSACENKSKKYSRTNAFQRQSVKRKPTKPSDKNEIQNDLYHWKKFVSHLVRFYIPNIIPNVDFSTTLCPTFKTIHQNVSPYTHFPHSFFHGSH